MIIDITHSEFAANNLFSRGHICSSSIYAWDDISVGPVPHTDDPAEWNDIRSRFVADTYGIDRATHQELGLVLPARLRELRDSTEVRLWLGNSVSDQLMFWRVLHIFKLLDLDVGVLRQAKHPSLENALRAGSPWLLSDGQVGEVVWERVTLARFEQSARSWEAFRLGSVDAQVREYARSRLYAQPHCLFWATLLGHYPSKRTGLDAIRERLLASVREHGPRLKQIIAFCMMPEPPGHLDQHGDSYLLHLLKGMSDERMVAPLVNLAGEPGLWDEMLVTLTDVGQMVLDGSRAALDVLSGGHWVGGVNVDVHEPERYWREDLLQSI